MDYNIIVKDEEFAQFSANVVARTDHVETILQQMLDTMHDVVGDNGALEGNTAENFAVFIETVAKLQEKIEHLGNSYQKLSDSFVAKVDECDQDIY